MKRQSFLYLLLIAALTFSCNTKPDEKKDAAIVATPANPEPTAEISEPANQADSELQKPEPRQSKSTSLQVASASGPDKSGGNKSTRRLARKQKASSKPASFFSRAATVSGPEAKTALTLADVYRHFDKTAQTFSILPNRDTTLICREGTSLKIPANAFVSEVTGLEVAGPVEISVKEYYKLSDIMLANLSTTSGKENLETAGMIHVTATSMNGPCALKPGRNMEIGFPYQTAKKGMQLFSGQWQENNIDWQLTQTPDQIDQIPDRTGNLFNGRYSELEVLPVYRGGEKGLKKHFARYAQYPLTALNEKTEGTVVLKIRIEKNGEISGVKVENSLSPGLDKSAAYAAYKMPRWRAGRVDNKPVEATHILPVTFSLEGTEINKKTRKQARRFERQLRQMGSLYTNVQDEGEPYYIPEKDSKAKLEKKLKSTGLHKADVAEVSRYLFSATQLGWINCDRFYGTRQPKIDYVIDHNSTDKVSVRVVFHSVRAIMPGFFRQKQYAVNNVPLGEKVTIVALKTEGENVMLAVKETSIKKAGESELVFEPVTMERLQEEMEKLDKLK